MFVASERFIRALGSRLTRRPHFRTSVIDLVLVLDIANLKYNSFTLYLEIIPRYDFVNN